MLDDQRPDQDDELAALLILALDGDDPVRISLLTRLALGMYADDSLAADLERMRRDGPDPVWVSNK